MSSRNIILLVVALAIAGLTAVGLRSRLQHGGGDGKHSVTSVQRILVATRDIAPGNFVRVGQDISWADWPANSIMEIHVREGSDALSSFEGAVARRHIKAGEPIATNVLIKPGAGGFLSAVLETGKRAVSIAVTATTGNAGFIFPGDRVDLILTHKVKVADGANSETEEATISETFVENVRVIAVDQQMDNPENKAILAKTVTVEATPKQAEKIQVASMLGMVSFTLRSLGDSVSAGADATGAESVSPSPLQSRSFTRDFEVSPMLERAGETNPRIRVVRGNETENIEFYRQAE